MELSEAIAKRRSYRGKYTGEVPPREHLRQIMQAGLDAPSGCNKQTVSLIAADEPELLSKLCSVIDPPLPADPPAMICVLTQRVNAYRDKCFAVQDYSAAVENMLLTVTALGYQSCWVEGHITDDDRICDKMAEILGVPGDYELVCCLPVGRAADEVPEAPRKKEFSECAWFGGFRCT